MNNDTNNNITIRRAALYLAEDLAYGPCDIRTAEGRYGKDAIDFALARDLIREYDEMYYSNI